MSIKPLEINSKELYIMKFITSADYEGKNSFDKFCMGVR